LTSKQIAGGSDLAENDLLLKRRNRKMKRLIMYLLLALMIPALSGCWYAAAAGAGAYGGYKLKEKGYKTQSPITKEKQENENNQN
jgi:hypothetical protein